MVDAAETNWMDVLDDVMGDQPRKYRGKVLQRWHLNASTTCWVYFIAAEETDMLDSPIKIGISNHPYARLAEMQQVCPAKLIILAVAPGGAAMEKRYHERFVSHRLHGEWFSRNPELLKLIRYWKVRYPLNAEVK
ncbi:GIY-YIG nuclease family protein [Sphingobium xenophagum]|uniref:GIY-YIG nuclease family protein n=1 Tax=Sphingobium xenophagum TaxID=121428 RepID=UPI000373A489|nr:GIY-YIG nuclease family protein [Sphingobium xenophagum]